MSFPRTVKYTHKRPRGKTRAIVAELTAQGLRNCEIAAQAGIATPNVTMHQKRNEGDDWRPRKRGGPKVEAQR
jgi:hypothetical protein